MDALQYLVVVIVGFAVICMPYMIVLSVRRRQKGRVVAILRDVLMMYLVFDIASPSIPVSAPRPVQWFSLLMLLLFVLDFFGLIDRLLAHSRKGVTK